MNTTTKKSTRAASVVAAIAATVAISACGTEIKAPAQDVGGSTDRSGGKFAPVPPRVSKPDAEQRTRKDAGKKDAHATSRHGAKQRQRDWDPVDRRMDWH